MKTKHPVILAIDTSCDDTSASVVFNQTVLSNIIASQTELHKPYGGVFPTVAKQAHKENIEATVKLAIKRANTNIKKYHLSLKAISLQSIDALAVTIGPGLAPALEVGINYTKKLAKQYQKPIIAINHIEGHALSQLAQAINKPVKKIKFPVLSIVVSGGHTQFIFFNKIGSYQVIGTTIDDSAGECLDKIGRMLNLGYPAGHIIEKFAKQGNQQEITFPLPMTTTKNFNMSFSGLKTFARNYLENNYGKSSLTKQQVYDFCASAQYGVFRHIMYKLGKALKEYKPKEVWLGGGVSSNIKLRQMIRQTIKKTLPSTNPPLKTPYTKKLCMDNASMIGVVASYKPKQNNNQDKLDRIPRWSIDKV